MTNKNLRSLPAVHVILKTPAIQELTQSLGQENVVAEIRHYLDELRNLLSKDSNQNLETSPESIGVEVSNRLATQYKPN